jgi:hypothetical protein
MQEETPDSINARTVHPAGSTFTGSNTEAAMLNGSMLRFGRCWKTAITVALAAVIFGTVVVSPAPGGPPPEETTTWVIVSKPPPPKKGQKPLPDALGVQLHAAGSPDGRLVTLNLNPTTLADGNVVDLHKGKCDCLHFHGNIGTKPDPAPNACGWGCVLPFDSAPATIQFLSGAIMLERSAIRKTDLIGTLNDAADDLEEAIDQIKGAIGSVPTRGRGWSRVTSFRFKTQLKLAKRNDSKAAERLRKASDPGLDPQARGVIVGEALNLIEKALKQKEAAFLLAVKRLHLLE